MNALTGGAVVALLPIGQGLLAGESLPIYVFVPQRFMPCTLASLEGRK